MNFIVCMKYTHVYNPKVIFGRVDWYGYGSNGQFVWNDHFLDRLNRLNMVDWTK